MIQDPRGVIGAVVHGLILLLIVAAVLCLATLVFGGSRLGRSRVSTQTPTRSQRPVSD